MNLNPNLAYLHAVELPTPFPVGPVTVYLANAPHEPLTLLDTGPLTVQAREALEHGLAGKGYTLADLDRIVISHAHVDHFGLAAELVDASGAQILTHARNAPALGDFETDRLSRTAFYGELLRKAAVPSGILGALGKATSGLEHYARPAAVDITLEEGDTLSMAGFTWQVLYTPGHAAGLICLYEATSRTLLSSDHLLADISSNPVVEPPLPGQRERPRSLALYTESLKRVAAMNISLALPSHGPAIHDVDALVARRLAFHDRRKEQVESALRNGARTTWDVTQVLFSGRSPLDTFLAVSEVIGHLDLLEIEGRIAAEDRGGIVVWKVL